MEEFERADPSSSGFRYPVKKDLTAALGGRFAFSVRRFALTMHEILATLSNACHGLPEIADDEAWRGEMRNNPPPDYEHE